LNVKILTFHRANNHGAALQSFALKNTIQKLGHSVEFIDYWSFDHHGDYQLIPKFRRSSSRSLFTGILQLVFKILPIIMRRKRFNSFRKKYLIKEGSVLRNKNDLKEISCDLIILGSDQIWRKSNYNGLNQFEWEYFGDSFNKEIPIISYAASMGVINVTENDIRDILKHLSKFQSISVRESNLRNLIIENGIKNVSKVLDPCMLLTKNEWINKFNIDSKSKKYILVYNLRENPKVDKVASQLSKELDVKIVRITGNANNWNYTNFLEQGGGPIEFLSLIKNSEFVISSSFHGVVFSIVFEKQFFASGMQPNSERVTSLLDEIGIGERYIDTDNLNDKVIESILNKIDYKSIKNKLNLKIDESIDFLKSELKNL
jgi:polysaccharide pyruvyl transferase WcaK-like protein